MKYKFFVGIDVSKLTFDVACLSSENSQVIVHNVFCNDGNGIKEMSDFLNKAFANYHLITIMLGRASFTDGFCALATLKAAKSITMEKTKNNLKRIFISGVAGFYRSTIAV